MSDGRVPITAAFDVFVSLHLTFAYRDIGSSKSS